jgi:Rrf2 family protein
MKVSTKGKYGLRVMVELALRDGKGPVQVNLIADSQSISGKYIHVLVSGLKSAGLIRGIRGPHGGYELARKPSEITAYEIVASLESDLVPSDCVSDTSSCPRTDVCATRELWCDVASAIRKVLSETTLDRLAERERGKRETALTYSI